MIKKAQMNTPKPAVKKPEENSKIQKTKNNEKI